MTRWLLYCFSFLALCQYPQFACAQGGVIPGAWQVDSYLPMLKGKKVALLINQTSRVNDSLLLDTLIKRNVKIVKIFVPEHGFRGFAEAGEKVNNTKDEKTGLPIISLYGKNKKPTKADLANIDILVYDLQDVGARFYTYISTMQYAMEACAENNKKFIILDRPNPNGNYVDGPVLDTSLRSFVGMQPVPIVYGMTAGEYAKMLVGENWFKNAVKLKMEIVTCKNYDHTTWYSLPVPPSPNLRTMAAVYCYPSLCLFEGTVVSVGRGTASPFQQWGHPDFMGKTVYNFMPRTPLGGVEPLYAYRNCYGQIAAADENEAKMILRKSIRIFWLIRAYEWYPYKDKFFNTFFEKLAGTKDLRKQIEKGMDEGAIKATWQPGLAAFKQIRKKYLLYTDFE
jgi:uncharacterized protein YbbC (DUF1343 family)